MRNTIAALIGTIFSFILALVIVALLHLPALVVMFLWPVIAVVICVILDKHHFYD